MAKKRFFILLCKLSDSITAWYLSRFEKPDNTAYIAERVSLIKTNIEKATKTFQVKACEGAITTLLFLPYGDEAYMEIMELKKMCWQRDSEIRLEHLRRVAEGANILSKLNLTA